LFATGNTITGGGNMIVGTGLNNDVIFSVGGINTNNEVARFKYNTGLVLRQFPLTFADGTVQNTAGSSVANTVYLQGGLNSANANVILLQGAVTSANANVVYLQTNLNNANANIALLQGAVTSANANIVYLQTNLNNANANIALLQGAMTSANANVVYLQTNLNNANSNIALLQGAVTSANANIVYLFAIETQQNTNIAGVNTYSYAAFSFANNAYAAANANSIYLQTNLNNANANIALLQGAMSSANANITYLYANLVGLNTYAYSAYAKANTGGGGGISASGYLSNTIIYSNSAGYLSNTSNLRFFESNNTVSISGNVAIGNSFFTIGDSTTGGLQFLPLSRIGLNSIYGGIWPATVTPASGNYGLLLSSTFNRLNAPTGGSVTIGIATSNTFRVQSGNPSSTSATAQATQVLQGGLGVADDSYFAANLGTGGIVTVTNTTSSISNTSGALVITGGVGVQGNLYTGNVVLASANAIVFGDNTRLSSRPPRFMEIIAVPAANAQVAVSNLFGIVEIPVSGTINMIRARTTTGTCNVSFNINGTSIGYVNANTSGAANTVATTINAYDALTVDVASPTGNGLVVMVRVQE
jgi:hypothetical protein